MNPEQTATHATESVREKDFNLHFCTMAHMYMCVGCGCSLLLDICIFLMFEGPKED